jgi:hypothetical protein
MATLAAGCSDDGDGAGFDTDPGPIDPRWLRRWATTSIPRRCPPCNGTSSRCASKASTAPPTSSHLSNAAVCWPCAAAATRLIVEDLLDEADGETPEERERSAYSAFRSLEADLRAGNALTPKVEGLVAACIRAEAGL